MTFRELVKNDGDIKYKNMMENSTPVPFFRSTSLVDNGVYKNKRETYINRLRREKK